MTDIDKIENDVICEEPQDELHKQLEELMADNMDLQKQYDLLMSQHIGLEDRFNLEKTRWKQTNTKLLAENEALNNHIKVLELSEEKGRKAMAQDRIRRIAAVPKLVIVAAAALALCVVPWVLQKLCVIGPQLAYTLQCGLMMVISWCYALIFDRTKK